MGVGSSDLSRVYKPALIPKPQEQKRLGVSAFRNSLGKDTASWTMIINVEDEDIS